MPDDFLDGRFFGRFAFAGSFDQSGFRLMTAMKAAWREALVPASETA